MSALTPKHIDRLFWRFAASGLKETAAIANLLAKDREAVVQIWLEELADLTPEDVGDAWKAFRMTGAKFWPSALELRALVPRLALIGQDRSLEAWGLLVQMLGTPGSAALSRIQAMGLPWVNEDGDMDRRMKHAAMACGGVRKLGQSRESEMMAHRANFRTAYQAVAGEERITRQPKALPMGARRNTLMFPVQGSES